MNHNQKYYLERNLLSPKTKCRGIFFKYLLTYKSLQLLFSRQNWWQSTYTWRDSCKLSPDLSQYIGSQTRNTQAIVSHLAQANHTVNVMKDFRALYNVRGRRFRLEKCRFLSTTEAVAIPLHSSALCTESNLRLPFNSPTPPYGPIHILRDTTIDRTGSSVFLLCTEHLQYLPIHIFVWIM